jgi:polyphenol oxidase
MTPPFHRADNLSTLPGIAHGFFGRDGGVSDGLYASLNCGPGSKDDPARVEENRARIVAALPGGERLITLAQIHSPNVYVVGPNWQDRPEGDGLVTALPGVILGIQTADCTPVLFAEPHARVIGAAHAGWKGAASGVLEAVIAAMESLGARRERIAAAIGPTISQANYEVGAEFRDRFLEAESAHARFFIPSDRHGYFRFDLPAYVTGRLAGAGISDVADLRLCTYPPENGFFSFRRTTHRAEPDYGRQISAIVVTR